MVCVIDWTGQICIKHRHDRTRLLRYFVTVCCITLAVFYNPGFSSCLLVLECVITVSPSLICTPACAQVLSVCIQVTWVNLLNAGISKYLHIVNVWTMYEYFQRKTREITNIHHIQCCEKGLSPSWFIRFCTFYTLKCQIINQIVIIDKDNMSM